MAIKAGNTLFSYDYGELLSELKGDLERGLLVPESIIGIVRKEESLRLSGLNYHPICDYYYPDAFEHDTPDELYNRDEFTEEEWAALQEEYDKNLEQYKKDLPRIENVTVTAAITEMERWHSILEDY